MIDKLLSDSLAEDKSRTSSQKWLRFLYHLLI